MIWYEWVVGSFQFVTAWWVTDRLTRKKGIVPDRALVSYHQRKTEKAARRVEIQRHYTSQDCTDCGKWIPTSGCVAYVRGMCRQCHSYAVERNKPPSGPEMLLIGRG